MTIALESVQGVKKVGRLGGISLRYALGGGGVGGIDTLREVKFRWVGGRDELFAQLVGWGGRKWALGTRNG